MNEKAEITLLLLCANACLLVTTSVRDDKIFGYFYLRVAHE